MRRWWSTHNACCGGPDIGRADADELIDVERAAVVPGFVDSHTHLVFAGERSAEYEARMSASATTAGNTGDRGRDRRATSDELRSATATRARALRAGGVTTMEIKSGYELTLEVNSGW